MDREFIRKQIKQQVCNVDCPSGTTIKCGEKRKLVCIKYQQALQTLGGIQYEYETKVADWESDAKVVMNRMGTKGWQAFSIANRLTYVVIYFRRVKRTI